MLPHHLFVVVAVLITATCGSAVDTKAVNIDVFPGIGKYFLYDQSLNWTDAYTVCKTGGGNLAVINSGAEANVLKVQLAKYGLASTHLGFHDLNTEGSYWTIEGDKINEAKESQWAPGYPAEETGNNCGSLTPSGIINIPCNTTQKPMCELPLWNDYNYIPKQGRYKFHRANATWQQAWEVCNSEGAHLLILSSEVEHRAMAAMYPTAGVMNRPVWVGVHRFYGNNQFTTIFNEPLLSTGFATWLPTIYPAGDYISQPYLAVYLNYSSQDGLVTRERMAVGDFICEKELHP